MIRFSYFKIDEINNKIVAFDDFFIIIINIKENTLELEDFFEFDIYGTTFLDLENKEREILIRKIDHKTYNKIEKERFSMLPTKRFSLFNTYNEIVLLKYYNTNYFLYSVNLNSLIISKLEFIELEDKDNCFDIIDVSNDNLYIIICTIYYDSMLFNTKTKKLIKFETDCFVDRVYFAKNNILFVSFHEQYDLPYTSIYKIKENEVVRLTPKGRVDIPQVDFYYYEERDELVYIERRESEHIQENNYDYWLVVSEINLETGEKRKLREHKIDTKYIDIYKDHIMRNTLMVNNNIIYILLEDKIMLYAYYSFKILNIITISNTILNNIKAFNVNIYISFNYNDFLIANEEQLLKKQRIFNFTTLSGNSVIGKVQGF